jgi:hypothetical protein
MSTIIDEFGQNAGKIWQTLHEKGPLSVKKLINTTYLNERQLHAAVGWLARENKICSNGTIYKNGETNLVGKIGTDAGTIWSVLSKSGTDVDLTSLSRLTRINVNDIYAAVGWLARENKIDVQTVMKQKNQQVRMKLKQ